MIKAVKIPAGVFGILSIICGVYVLFDGENIGDEAVKFSGAIALIGTGLYFTLATIGGKNLPMAKSAGGNTLLFAAMVWVLTLVLYALLGGFAK